MIWMQILKKALNQNKKNVSDQSLKLMAPLFKSEEVKRDQLKKVIKYTLNNFFANLVDISSIIERINKCQKIQYHH